MRSASFILLQGVPSTISLDEVRDSILDVDGVLSVHELHVWQLSETKIIASVHVLASRNHDFMPVAAKIRKALHHHGIHSSTIQPEYLRQSGPEEMYKVCPILLIAQHVYLTDQKTTASCLIMCPPDQECDPQENACCREYLFFRHLSTAIHQAKFSSPCWRGLNTLHIIASFTIHKYNRLKRYKCHILHS